MRAVKLPFCLVMWSTFTEVGDVMKVQIGTADSWFAFLVRGSVKLDWPAGDPRPDYIEGRWPGQTEIILEAPMWIPINKIDARNTIALEEDTVALCFLPLDDDLLRDAFPPAIFEKIQSGVADGPLFEAFHLLSENQVDPHTLLAREGDISVIDLDGVKNTILNDLTGMSGPGQAVDWRAQPKRLKKANRTIRRRNDGG
jgi:hypothetical protein